MNISSGTLLAVNPDYDNLKILSEKRLYLLNGMSLIKKMQLGNYILKKIVDNIFNRLLWVICFCVVSSS